MQDIKLHLLVMNLLHSTNHINYHHSNILIINSLVLQANSNMYHIFSQNDFYYISIIHLIIYYISNVNLSHSTKTSPILSNSYDILYYITVILYSHILSYQEYAIIYGYSYQYQYKNNPKSTFLLISLNQSINVYYFPIYYLSLFFNDYNSLLNPIYYSIQSNYFPFILLISLNSLNNF